MVIAWWSREEAWLVHFCEEFRLSRMTFCHKSTNDIGLWVHEYKGAHDRTTFPTIINENSSANRYLLIDLWNQWEKIDENYTFDNGFLHSKNVQLLSHHPLNEKYILWSAMRPSPHWCESKVKISQSKPRYTDAQFDPTIFIRLSSLDFSMPLRKTWIEYKQKYKLKTILITQSHFGLFVLGVW